jgi:hypothetical protein
MIEDLFSSDIDSMFSKMDQETVYHAVKTEVLFAAQVAKANAFFVVLYDTIHDNAADKACWFDAAAGIDPNTGLPPDLRRANKGVAYSLERICQLGDFVVRNAYVTLGNSVQHQLIGIRQGAHASSYMANITCCHFEKRFVVRFPYHSLQHNIFKYCDDFQVINSPFFLLKYRDIYPVSSGISLINNEVQPSPGRKAESHFLDTLTYVTENDEVHITLYDKRSSYSFDINRFPDVESNASRIQSHSVFFGELVRMFRINTLQDGFLRKSTEQQHILLLRRDTGEASSTVSFNASLGPKSTLKIHVYKEPFRI